MKVFVTGASGFVGAAVVRELLNAGHTVSGLARSEKSADALRKAGAEIHPGDIYDTESLVRGAARCDAVIHTAFDHDFSKFKESCELDRRVILAMGTSLAGTGKPLVITSGIGLLHEARTVVETDVVKKSEAIPRAASEEAANEARAKGADVYVVRLPPTTHGKGDQGFIPMIAAMAKEKGESAYIGEGTNRWPAVHRFDAAAMYRLIIEKRPAQKTFHAVAESGIHFKEIAEAIGNGLKLPTVSKDAAAAQKHFTWFLHFASIDCHASSEQSRNVLGWEPKEIALLEDVSANYF